MNYTKEFRFLFIISVIFIINIQTSSVSCELQKLSLYIQKLLMNNVKFQSTPIAPKQWSTKKITTFMDLVAPKYVAEEHTIVTSDGYMLTLHRISGSAQSPTDEKKPVVLFLHGLMAASDIWILRGPDEDLFYLLVDSGYDVWALNARGNFYSKRHQRLSTRDSQFWKFSWHEIGVYDVPTSIDYILNLTGQPKLSLIGHSMGGTIELVTLSELPEYNNKLNVAIALAPVSIVTHKVPGLINNIVLRYGNQIKELLSLLKINEIFPRSLSLDYDFGYIFLKVCDKVHIRTACAKLYEYFLGVSDFEELDYSLLARARHHYPQGTSLQTLSHYQQIIVSKQFRRYDYGPIGNMKAYGNIINSEYPLNKISAPLVIYYGLDDPLSTPEDIQVLLEQIPHAVTKKIQYHKFGHLDFVLLNQTKYFYENIIQVLHHYNK